MKQRTSLLLLFLFVLTLIACAPLNPFQSDIDSVIKDDSRNAGIVVSAYSANVLDRSTLVFDLQKVAATDSHADVFRVFLQFAEKEKKPNL